MIEEKVAKLKLVVDEKNKIKWKNDPLIPNLGLFRIVNEDHTIGNVIHHKLIGLKGVIFCAYKKPHPLEYFIVVKIVTNGKLTATQALDCSLKDLYIELSLIEEALKLIKNM
jgi:DNA-directed RNA polymerase II subunit RPB11